VGGACRKRTSDLCSRTQSEAVKEGRDIARRDKTEFFLHAQDGRIREHNSYRVGPRPAEETATDQTAGPLVLLR
jgi:hypothetical protein